MSVLYLIRVRDLKIIKKYAYHNFDVIVAKIIAKQE